MTLALASLAALTVHKGIAVVIIHKAQLEVRFSSVTATFLGEAAKLLVSLIALQVGKSRSSRSRADYVALEQQSSPSKVIDIDDSVDSDKTLIEEAETDWSEHDRSIVSSVPRSTRTLALVAILYVAQNNAYLYASFVLQPTVMQAIWQLRIISTAVASRIILKRRFTVQQIIGMALLSVSVLVINEALSRQTTSLNVGAISSTGFIAALIACVLSGIAGVLVEAELKGAEANMWAVNCQMSLFSLAPALIFVLYETFVSASAADVSGLQGFEQLWPWTVVLVHGVAGLLVAFVTKFASTVARSFSGAFAILLTLAFSIMAGTRPDPVLPHGVKCYMFLLGIGGLYLSTWLYAFTAAAAAPKDSNQNGTSSDKEAV